MWPYYPDLLAQPVPRYTSYPPATAFGADVGAADQAEALNAVKAGSRLSAYLHIPYCQSICWYCGCNTGLAGKAQRLHAYLKALEAEISMVARMLGGRAKLSRIAFGGGSPNAIEPLDFVRLVDMLVTSFAARDAEISVEIDPRTFTLEWAMTLAIAGVSRVSFGVQSFDPDIQAAIGRIQPAGMIETCVAALRARGIASTNFDLMYGLPMQTIEKLDSTLDAVLRIAPERIALFGYAHLPGMFPRQRRIDECSLPDMKARFDMAAYGHDRLVAAGYKAIGFDHFALPGDPLFEAAEAGRLHRNFQGFTDDDSDALIGLGASAISIFPDRIIQNEKRPGPYRERCGAGLLAGSRGVMRSADAQRRASIIETLLCSGKAQMGADLASATARTQLHQFAGEGLIRMDGDTFCLEESARPYARHIAAIFDATRPEAFARR